MKLWKAIVNVLSSILASIAFGQVLPPLVRWNVDIESPENPIITLSQGESLEMSPIFRYREQTISIPTSANVRLYWRLPSGTNAPYYVDGRVDTNGRAIAMIPGTIDIPTNRYWFWFEVSTGAVVSLRAQGILFVRPGYGGGGIPPRTYSETDPVFTNWLATNVLSGADDLARSLASNALGGVVAVSGRVDVLGAVAVTNESDPVYSAWRMNSTKIEIGLNASANDGGVAIGEGSVADMGCAVGSGAYAGMGGAVGAWAMTEGGGAIGHGARTSSGFAGGLDARCQDEGENGIDAIQLGTGVNTNPLSMQVYSYPLLSPDGMIYPTRIPYVLTNAAIAGTFGSITSGVAYLPSPNLSNVLASGNTALSSSGSVENWTVTNTLTASSVRGPGKGDIFIRDSYFFAGAGLYYVAGVGSQNLGLDGSRWGTFFGRGINLAARNAGSSVPTITNFTSSTVATNEDWVPTCSAVRNYLTNKTVIIILPTSTNGLPSGALWNNGGTIAIVP